MSIVHIYRIDINLSLYMWGDTIILYTYTDICMYACMLLYVCGLIGYIGMHVSLYVPLCIYHLPQCHALGCICEAMIV